MTWKRGRHRSYGEDCLSGRGLDPDPPSRGFRLQVCVISALFCKRLQERTPVICERDKVKKRGGDCRRRENTRTGKGSKTCEGSVRKTRERRERELTTKHIPLLS